MSFFPMISLGLTEITDRCLIMNKQPTSFPALVSPLTVCSSSRLPLMFRYFTFLQDEQNSWLPLVVH